MFLSHASEDKAEVVIPLAEELAARGVRVWFDRQQLMLGDSLSQKIDDGLAHSRFGAVVLSRSFFAKEWPQRELDGLVARETALGAKVILPIWHEISRDEILGFSPTLAGKLAARTADGLGAVADQIMEVLGGPVDAGQIVTGSPRQPEESASRGSLDLEPTEQVDRDESLSALVRSAVVQQRLPELRAEVVKRVSAADQALALGASGDFGPAIENVVALGGVLALHAPSDPVTKFAITGPHRIFDAAQQVSSAWQIQERITACWPSTLASVRGLGALLTRLELWSALRTLAGHPPPPGSSKIYPGWLCWMEVQVARNRGMPANAETYRQPIRDTAQLIARTPELRQDGPNDNTTLDSVIAFDFLRASLRSTQRCAPDDQPRPSRTSSISTPPQFVHSQGV